MPLSSSASITGMPARQTLPTTTTSGRGPSCSAPKPSLSSMPRRLELRAHRRVHVAIRTAHPVAGGPCDGGHTAHKSTADTDNVDVHDRAECTCAPRARVSGAGYQGDARHDLIDHHRRSGGAGPRCNPRAAAACSVSTPNSMRERTYFAQLCLVQIASEELAVCIDPLRTSASRCAAPAVGRDGTVAQDRARGAPGSGSARSDGRCGQQHLRHAGGRRLVGSSAQVGYARTGAAAARHRPAQEPDPHRLVAPTVIAPRSWTTRSMMCATCTAPGKARRAAGQTGARSVVRGRDRRSWGMAFLRDRPGRGLARFKAFAELDPDRQRLARALAAWREQRAIQANRPRGWILPDAALRDIVFQVPRDRAALERLSELPEGIRENSGAQLLELIRAAAVPVPPWTAAPAPPARSGASRESAAPFGHHAADRE